MTVVSDAETRERDITSTAVVTALAVLVIVTATFGALIVVFFWRAQNGYLWEHLHLPATLWLSTALLLISSLVFEAARKRLKAGDRAAFFRLMQWTTGLGVLFLAGQVIAWLQILRSNVTLARDKHAWFVFLFSSLHGLHIVAGLGGLGYLLYRTHEPVSGPKYQMTTRAAATGMAIFWHYMGFIWIVLFGLLLGWRR